MSSLMDLELHLSGKTGTAELDIYHPNHGLFHRIYDIFRSHLSRSILLQSELQMDTLREMHV